MKIIIPVHSFVDVITNSSSELFVLDTNKSVEMVENIIINYWNQIREEKNFDGYPSNISDILTVEVESGKSLLKTFKDWDFNARNINSKRSYIVINSTKSNSIPWELIEFIELTFKAERWHLG